MMYMKYRTKDGEIGPRGFDGYPGQQGDDGKCNQSKCRIDLITLMIVKKLEDRFVRKLTEAEITQIYNSINSNNSKIYKKNVGNDMTYTQLKLLDDEITYNIEVLDNLDIDYFTTTTIDTIFGKIKV